MPRLRLWKGRAGRDDELRAELEAVPEIGFDPNRHFHDHFFMKKIRPAEMPRHWFDRPIPERWKKQTVGAEWNQTAGRKPLLENSEPDS
jgi:hypothetical protein